MTIRIFRFLTLAFIVSTSHSFVPLYRRTRSLISVREDWFLRSSFYDQFEDFDDDEEEYEEDDYENLDPASVANFRSKMSNIFGDSNDEQGSSVDELINYARSKGSLSSSTTQLTKWARPEEKIRPGVVLLANPAKFCSDFRGRMSTPSPNLLSRFGLTLPPPADLGPDRRADLLPVLLVIDIQKGRGTRAILLNRRTGYLLGDLEKPGGDTSQPAPLLEKFCIQPLWFGGVDNVSSGLEMLHLCPAVVGAQQLTEDGLWWGGDPAQAQEALSNPALDRVYTGFDFKFFVQSTIWSSRELEREIKDGTWFCAQVSKEVLFTPRDRMGTRRAKPLWTEIMELLGGEYKDVRDELYGDQE